jgi:hypothetical protein
MSETEFRASQICRVLGNPKIYALIKEMDRIGQASLAELAAAIGRSPSTTCIHLKTLRQTQLARYLNTEDRTLHRVKFPKILQIMRDLESLVEEIRRQER